MITIIDYGVCNTGSILNMLERMRIDAEISNKPKVIEKADKLILPGIGSFDTGVKNIKELGLWDLLDQKVSHEKTPLLGICLGMQLLTKCSDEGMQEGFSWINAKARKFQPSETLVVPHMRWNRVHVEQDNPIVSNIETDNRFYFTHSHYVICESPENVITNTEYGVKFHSVISKENIWGTQFHPEKSHRFGMTLLHNFSTKC